MKLIFCCLPLCCLVACKPSSSADPPNQANQIGTEPTTESMNPSDSQSPTSSGDQSDPKTEVKPSAQPDGKLEPQKTTKPAGDDRYLGLTKEEAAALATKEGRRHRISMEDGKVMMGTMDFRPERLNFVIAAGKVTRVTRG